MVEEPRTRSTDRTMVLAAAVLFSTGGAAVKACALTPWQIASFRSGIAAVALLVMLPSARRAWDRRTVLVAVAYAATMILYVLANRLTTAANTIFLQGTAPLYVLILSPLLLQEKTRRRDLPFMAAIAGGMLMFFVGSQPQATTAPNPALGNVVAVAIGLSWALTLIGIRWLGRSERQQPGAAAAAVACGNLVAFLVALPLALPVRPATPPDWLMVAYLGVLQIAIAYVFLTRGLQRVPVLEASLLLLLEPVLNPVWAWLVHGERPGGWALAGGAIIVAATLTRTLTVGAERSPAHPDEGRQAHPRF